MTPEQNVLEPINHTAEIILNILKSSWEPKNPSEDTRVP
jgi:hypothetical protein